VLQYRVSHRLKTAPLVSQLCLIEHRNAVLLGIVSDGLLLNDSVLQLNIHDGFTAVQGNALYVSSVVRKIKRETPIPILQERGRVSQPVWKRPETLTSTGIRTPASYARSESVYGLRCSGPHYNLNTFKIMLFF